MADAHTRWDCLHYHSCLALAACGGVHFREWVQWSCLACEAYVPAGPEGSEDSPWLEWVPIEEVHAPDVHRPPRRRGLRVRLAMRRHRRRSLRPSDRLTRWGETFSDRWRWRALRQLGPEVLPIIGVVESAALGLVALEHRVWVRAARRVELGLLPVVRVRAAACPECRRLRPTLPHLEDRVPTRLGRCGGCGGVLLPRLQCPECGLVADGTLRGRCIRCGEDLRGGVALPALLVAEERDQAAERAAAEGRDQELEEAVAELGLKLQRVKAPGLAAAVAAATWAQLSLFGGA